MRLHLKPYRADEVPDEIGRDLIVLQDLADLLRELEALRPQFAGMERLWRGLDSEPTRIARLIKNTMITFSRCFAKTDISESRVKWTLRTSRFYLRGRVHV